MRLSRKVISLTTFTAFGLAAIAMANIGPLSSIGPVTSTVQQAGLTTAGQNASGKLDPEIKLSITAAQNGVPELIGLVEDGVRRFKTTTVYARISSKSKGSVEYTVDGTPVGREESLADNNFNRQKLDLTDFQNSGESVLRASFRPADNGFSNDDDEISFEVDTRGPVLISASLINDPSSDIVGLKLALDDDDLVPQPQRGLFAISRYSPTGAKHPLKNDNSSDSEVTGSVTVDDNDAYIQLKGPLAAGNYVVELSAGLKDNLGNPAGQLNTTEQEAQTATFSVGVSQPLGPAIAFPEFIPRQEAQGNDDFNPGNHVETRVSRLYYNRNAPRVVEIINRTVKSWNSSAVSDARRRASHARDKTDTAGALVQRLQLESDELGQQFADQRRQLSQIERRRVAESNRLERVRAIQAELSQLKQPTEDVTFTGKRTLRQVTRATVANATIDKARAANSTVTNGTARGGKTVLGPTGTAIPAQEAIEGGRTTKATTENGTIDTGTLTAGNITSGSITGGTAEGIVVGGKLIMATVASTQSGTATISQATITQGQTTGGTITGGKTTEGNGTFNANAPQTITNGVTVGGTHTEGTTEGTVTGALIQTVDLINVVIEDLVLRPVNPHKKRIDALNAELTALTGTIEPNSKPDGNLARKVASLDDEAKGLQDDIGRTQSAINDAKKKIQDAQRREQIASRNQFEAEVAAATTDPNTYAPADLESIDRVMQCSISVIGEGLIQIRGPIRGINEIRRMINQIDSPLGQVKVGLFTVQVNGEHGDEMDEVAARIEGHIDLSRFLTNQSLQLLRRAIQETAAMEIAQADQQSPFGQRPQSQVDRDRRYVYAFFGRDFVEELYAMDSEFLRTQNKLLSLHAMDTVSLSQSMFILALARNDIREAILQRFMELVRNELPQAEYTQRRMAGMLQKSREASRLRRIIGVTGFANPAEPKLPKYDTDILNEYTQKACEQYRFHNFINFFTADNYGGDVMTPVQREFIRLAQIFKSQMLAEVELKQRIVERSLIQSSSADLDRMRRNAAREHQTAIESVRHANRKREEAAGRVSTVLSQKLFKQLGWVIAAQNVPFQQLGTLNIEPLTKIVGPSGFFDRLADRDYVIELPTIELPAAAKRPSISILISQTMAPKSASITIKDDKQAESWVTLYYQLLHIAQNIDKEFSDVQFSGVGEEIQERERGYVQYLADKMTNAKTDATNRFNKSRLEPSAEPLNDKATKALAINQASRDKESLYYSDAMKVDNISKVVKVLFHYRALSERVSAKLFELRQRESDLRELMAREEIPVDEIINTATIIRAELTAATIEGSKLRELVNDVFGEVQLAFQELIAAQTDVTIARRIERVSRVELDNKKLLDYLIDEKEEKFIELVEGTRSHIANIDNYLKRQAIALEDDFKVQFYDPAFSGVRAEGRDQAVSLGQIERTTILTNNRTFAKVSPQATMEFDLPKRAPVVVEAMSGAKALMQDYGDLVNDPTFVGLTGVLSGSPAVGNSGDGSAPSVRSVVPGLETDSKTSFLSGGPPDSVGGRAKTNLEQLIPDPAIYRFQTGTGFEIRPVIQPDGHSVIYDFNYLYTTNVREPVDPNEKHLGRVKQHYVHTQVQTSSFELREISRYQVALKASRTSRGVPLLEEIPVAGRLFKPAPNAESSLQQNIILGHTTVYPTLYDLMGLRWSSHVADLDHENLRDLEHVVRGRNRAINNYVFDHASDKVDDFLDIERRYPQHYRPDLYRQQSHPSPYHPGGFVYPDATPDPRGREYYRGDDRPQEQRLNPPYDEYRRGPSDYYRRGLERIDSALPSPGRPRPETIRNDTATPESTTPGLNGYSRPLRSPAGQFQSDIITDGQRATSDQGIRHRHSQSPESSTTTNPTSDPPALRFLPPPTNPAPAAEESAANIRLMNHEQSSEPSPTGKSTVTSAAEKDEEQRTNRPPSSRGFLRKLFTRP